MEGARIPVDDHSIDVVWCCLVLGGLAGPALTRAVSELERVIKEDGLLFLVENTSAQPDGPTWKFRPVDEYRHLVPWARLQHLHDYMDLNETISVMAGRRQPTRLEPALEESGAATHDGH
jgi:ubiquinone/menaquinone biosynthesis C-methylase UbiE